VEGSTIVPQISVEVGDLVRYKGKVGKVLVKGLWLIKVKFENHVMVLSISEVEPVGGDK